MNAFNLVAYFLTILILLGVDTPLFTIANCTTSYYLNNGSEMIQSIKTTQNHVAYMSVDRQVITVPDDIPDLALAINVSNPGTTILVKRGVYNCPSIVWKNNITIIGLEPFQINSTGMCIFRIIVSNNIKLTNISMEPVTGDMIVTIIDSMNITVDNNTLSRVNLEIQLSRNIHIYNTTMYIPLNNPKVSIMHSDNVLLINNRIFTHDFTYLGIFDHGKVLVHGSRNVLLKNSVIGRGFDLEIRYSEYVTLINVFIQYGDMIIDYDSIRSLNAIEVYVGSFDYFTPKPLVFLRDRDMKMTRLKDLYSVIGSVILYNVSNLIIDDLNMERVYFGLKIYGSNNIVVKRSVFIDVVTPIYVSRSNNIVFDNILLLNPLNNILGLTSNITLNNLVFKYTDSSRTTLHYIKITPREDGVLIIPIRIYPLMISNCRNILLSNSTLSYLILFNNQNLSIANVDFTGKPGLCFQHLCHYYYFEYTKLRDVLIIKPELDSMVYDINNIQVFENVTVLNRSIVLLKHVSFQRVVDLRYKYGSIGFLILYNVSNVKVNGSNLIDGISAIIINSRYIDLYGVENPVNIIAYKVENLYVYACVFDNIRLISIELKVYNESRRPIIYRYNGKLFIERMNNYFGELPLPDYDGDGIYDRAFRYRDTYYSYALAKPPRYYEIIGYIDEITDIVSYDIEGVAYCSICLNETVFSDKISIPFNSTFPLNVDLEISQGYRVLNRITYWNLTGYNTIEITIPRDEILLGYYTLRIYIYIGDLRGKSESEILILQKQGKIVICERMIEIDNTPPIINIFEPSNNTVVYHGLMRIKWSIDDYSLEEAYLIINGKKIEILHQGEYEINVDELSEGLHNITIYARDRAGNVAFKTILIYKAAFNPLILLIIAILIITGSIIIVYVLRFKRRSGPAGI